MAGPHGCIRGFCPRRYGPHIIRHAHDGESTVFCTGVCWFRSDRLGRQMAARAASLLLVDSGADIVRVISSPLRLGGARARWALT